MHFLSHRDYRAIPELDEYDPGMLDETEQADMSPVRLLTHTSLVVAESSF